MSEYGRLTRHGRYDAQPNIRTLISADIFSEEKRIVHNSDQGKNTFGLDTLIAKKISIIQKSIDLCQYDDAGNDLIDMFMAGREVPGLREQLKPFFFTIAKRDNGLCASFISLFYNSGSHPFERDFKKSANWAKKSAAKGNYLGERYLAWLYSIGRGVRKNSKLSQLYSERAEAGQRRNEMG